MTQTTIYITRHGETQWNIEGRIQGRLDSSLTAKGIQQAMGLRDALKTVDSSAIYASPSPRTVKTAEILRHQRETEIIDLQ